jgi:hypothetical protein
MDLLTKRKLQIARIYSTYTKFSSTTRKLNVGRKKAKIFFPESSSFTRNGSFKKDPLFPCIKATNATKKSQNDMKGSISTISCYIKCIFIYLLH